MKNTFYILLLFLLISCSRKELLLPDQYVNWFNTADNGLSVKKEVEDYIFSAKLLPAELMAVREILPDAVTANSLNEEMKRFDGNYYVQFRIEDKQGSKNALMKDLHSTKEFYGRVGYFNFIAENDFKLLAGADTLHCQLLHFENTYGITPFNDIQMAFKADSLGLDSNRDFTLIWNDRALGNGMLKFQFDREDLKVIPDLKLN